MKTNKIHGLDTLRAMAISWVLLTHYQGFASRAHTFGFIANVGWVGVDLFFMLSGYLIGNQIFSVVARGESLSLRRFFFRRFMRTLPNYWVVVAAFFLIPALCGLATLPPLWKFLTFTQNFGLIAGTAFSHAWSLCVEEQFYVIFPLMVVLLARFKHSVRLYWIVMVSALASGIILRWILWDQISPSGVTDENQFMTDIYYSSFCRSDELIIGVSLALIKNFHKSFWARLMQHGHSLLLAGCIATVLSLVWLEDDQLGLWQVVAGFPALGLSFGLLTLAALSPVSWLHRYRVPGASTLATLSFAIYLTHKQFWIVTVPVLRQYGFQASQPVTIIVLMVASLMLGGALYLLVERPFLNLRGRFDSLLSTRQSVPNDSGLRQI